MSGNVVILMQSYQVPDFWLRIKFVKLFLGEQSVGQQASVLVDKELLGAVNVDQHRDDITCPLGAALGTVWIRVGWIWNPRHPLRHIFLLIEAFVQE